MNISSIKSDLKTPENNNINNKLSKSNSQFSKNNNPRASYTNSNNRISENDASSKIKSIENTYFMNK